MNPSPDEFDTLRRLLRFKRHESPPPGYFERLPGRIIAELRAGENDSSTSRWQAWIDNWEFKPVLAYAYGLAVAGLMVFGLGLSTVLQDTNEAGLETNGPSLALVPAAAAQEPAEWTPLVAFPPFRAPVVWPPSSIGPVTSSGTAGYFPSQQGARVVPASFHVGRP